MTMQAVVLEVQRDRLLVRDCFGKQAVIVHTSNTRQFRPGNRIWILYSGVMTLSIPPQIHALKIIVLPGIGPWCRGFL